jgi:hypothetical protein
MITGWPPILQISIGIVYSLFSHLVLCIALSMVVRKPVQICSLNLIFVT